MHANETFVSIDPVEAGARSSSEERKDADVLIVRSPFVELRVAVPHRPSLRPIFLRCYSKRT